MATAAVGDFLHRLTGGMAAELLGNEPDRALVERVLANRDEAALRAIVFRHGPMVYRVCRRVLRCPQDAEDAFQAVFLVLARELHSLRQRDSLAGWLHGVALRVSRKARARAVAQRRWEDGAARPEAVSPDDLTWAEVRSVLDAELGRLPDRWRLPLVLCYLEGHTQDEAAERLGWHKSTLRRRLEQAREALGNRLKARGIAGAAALLVTLASESLAEAMPPACMDSTIAAALAVASGKPLALAASANVAALTRGVLTAMLVKKTGIVAGVLTVLALLTATIGGSLSAAHAGLPGDEPGQPPARAKAHEPRKEELKKPLTLEGHTGEIWCVHFSPDGKRIVTGGGTMPRGIGGARPPGGANPPASAEVKVWDAEKGKELFALDGHTSMVKSVHFSPDGKRIATAALDQTIRVWDAEKGKEVFNIGGLGRPVGSVSFSPDGKRLAGIGAGRIVVWDAENGKELLTLKTDAIPGGNVCFSPDGKRIAGVYPWSVQGKPAPAEIKLWDAEKGKELLTIKTPYSFGTVNLSFAPDGKRLATAGLDEKVRVWDTEKGEELLAIEGHKGKVSGVCFSPDGKRIASVDWDAAVKVWDAEKGKELHNLKAHTDHMRAVCFSPDGKRLATASKDQSVRVWTLDAAK